MLAEGGLVAFPTETVYGLGADATNPAAIARLYQAKGRPAFNPLIAHVGDIAAARRIARFDAAGDRAGRGVLAGAADAGAAEDARTAPVADLATAGLDTVAIRVPAHPVAREILRAFGGAGGGAVGEPVGPRLADHGRACAERPCGADRSDRRWRAGRGRRRIHHRRLLRRRRCCCAPAACRAARSSACSAARWCSRPQDADSDSGQPLAPGMLASHYAPRTRVRLNADSVEAGEALLAFGLGCNCRELTPRPR